MQVRRDHGPLIGVGAVERVMKRTQGDHAAASMRTDTVVARRFEEKTVAGMDQARRGVGFAAGMENRLGMRLRDRKVSPAAAGRRGKEVGERDQDRTKGFERDEKLGLRPLYRRTGNFGGRIGGGERGITRRTVGFGKRRGRSEETLLKASQRHVPHQNIAGKIAALGSEINQGIVVAWPGARIGAQAESRRKRAGNGPAEEALGTKGKGGWLDLARTRHLAIYFA